VYPSVEEAANTTGHARPWPLVPPQRLGGG
jgi:hypothetical protein